MRRSYLAAEQSARCPARPCAKHGSPPQSSRAPTTHTRQLRHGSIAHAEQGGSSGATVRPAAEPAAGASLCTGGLPGGSARAPHRAPRCTCATPASGRRSRAATSPDAASAPSSRCSASRRRSGTGLAVSAAYASCAPQTDGFRVWVLPYPPLSAPEGGQQQHRAVHSNESWRECDILGIPVMPWHSRATARSGRHESGTLALPKVGAALPMMLCRALRAPQAARPQRGPPRPPRRRAACARAAAAARRGAQSAWGARSAWGVQNRAWGSRASWRPASSA